VLSSAAAALDELFEHPAGLSAITANAEPLLNEGTFFRLRCDRPIDARIQ
jgi:hypothetical protein